MSNNRLSFGKKHRNNLDTWLHFPATSCSSKCWAGGRADKLHGGIPESFCRYKYNNKCKHKCKQLLLRQIFSSSWKCSIQLTFISLNECLWVYGAENPQIVQKQNHKFTLKSFLELSNDSMCIVNITTNQSLLLNEQKKIRLGNIWYKLWTTGQDL